MPASLTEWLSLLERRHPREVDLGLDRVRAVWERLGSPVPAKRCVVVAGTNGKGSTVAVIRAVLERLGLRCGTYTTPHIHAYNERVGFAGRLADDRQFTEAFERIEAARGDVSLSYFEFGTLAAFLILQDQGLDCAVMEIGLGGRLDAVNLLDGDCTVITPIGLDHQEYLGDTREAIGREKAGIIRRGRPLVIGDRDPPDSVLETARERAAPVRRIGIDFELSARGEQAVFRYGDRSVALPRPTLAGAHQFDNAATGLAAVLELEPEAIGRGAALRSGMQSVRLRGRFERVADAPAVWLDVGHNPLGAEVVARTLEQRMRVEKITRVHCVLGMLADKDAGAAARALGGVVADWYCAGLGSNRGQSGAQLAEQVRAAVAPATVRACGTVAEALAAALKDAKPTDGVLVFGSFLTVDAALDALAAATGSDGTTVPA
ncbi:MAG: bifunctional tetrahydrofolate synthase/dihydrofolate synthase [Xanthomonadales bacterium]